MQAVPSLVGTGTAVAAAAAGLAFGEPDALTASIPRSATRRKFTLDYDSRRFSLSRPGTSSATNHLSVEDHFITTGSRQQPAEAVASNPAPPATRQPRAADTQTTPPKASSSRRQSILRHGPAPAPGAEDARDSLSSSGSWMRRLSIRPLSQHGSPRSSVVGPDAPSLFSHGSNAPILSPTGSVAPQLPPNKLVKRATSGQDNAGSIARRGTLRRPATSHQRSATLQQLQYPGTPPGQSAPKDSLDRRSRPRASTTVAADVSTVIHEAPGWTSFFHARRARPTGRGLHSRSAEDGPGNSQLPARRLHIRQDSLARAYLVRPSMVSGEEGAPGPPTEALPEPQAVPEAAPQAPAEAGVEEHDMRPDFKASPPSPDKAATAATTTTSPDGTPKRARRSISTHLSSPTSWMSKTGSIRRAKRGSEGKDGSGKRHASAPAGGPQHGARDDAKVATDGTLISPGQGQDAADLDVKVRLPLGTRRRNLSAPIPPLSRLSSFNADLARLGNSSPTSSPGSSRHAQPHPDAAGPSQPGMPVAQDRAASTERGSTERGSTFASSVFDGRDLASGDDDDTDFRSDTLFDSLRTAGSARIRAVETPAESMFDESPPGTAGNGKTKRLSIQEILGRPWDGDTKIVEEDEGMPTPSRRDRSLLGLESSDDDDDDEGQRQLDEAFADTSRTSREFGRPSLDTDDDDWARDEENTLSNHLSPPTSSVNSRRGVSPQLRAALASISGNGGTDTPNWDGASDRPRSSIFDWSEPSLHEKAEVNGHWPRPKTVHGKHEMDLRGGRAASRKGPMSGHVRSQSVPVVPDPSEAAKAAPKFGTWGLGTKTASEDWDDDFDFEEAGPGGELGKSAPKTSSMVVPPSIQATQPTVKAHSGQIRELSLLVSSLKRLCRQGRELDLLDGPAEPLWREAENVIALASPDEDDEDDGDDGDEGESSVDFDASTIDEEFVDEGFDAASLDLAAEHYDASFDVSEPNIPKTSVVKERQVVRRRSVFSPEDDIFGGHWPLADENKRPETPRTPERTREFHTPDGTVVASVMEAMQQHRATSNLRRSPVKPSKAKLFFDTNSLQELVKRANTLFHTLSDTVRRAELLTQSPAVTPKQERHRRADGSPAFTRVFTDPAASPPKRLPKSQSTPTVLSRTSIDSPASNGMGQRMQMMTVS